MAVVTALKTNESGLPSVKAALTADSIPFSKSEGTSCTSSRIRLTTSGLPSVDACWHMCAATRWRIYGATLSLRVRFLHPHLPSSSFSFPEPHDMLEVDSSGIVSHR